MIPGGVTFQRLKAVFRPKPGRRYFDKHGGFDIEFRYLEQTVYIEGSHEHAFQAGWGVQPVHTYVPDEDNWDRCLPEWLHGRRPIIVARLRTFPAHEVKTDPGYPALSDGDISWGQLHRDYPPSNDP